MIIPLYFGVGELLGVHYLTQDNYYITGALFSKMLHIHYSVPCEKMHRPNIASMLALVQLPEDHAPSERSEPILN